MKELSIRVNVHLHGSILMGIGLVFMFMFFFGLDASAGTLAPPQVLAVYPDHESHNAEVTTPISITYDQDMDPLTVNPLSFVVQSRQTGWLTETLSVNGGIITLQPDNPLHAGELVQVTATTATLSLDGEAPLQPTVWQFTTAPWRGNAYFQVYQVLPFTNGEVAALGDLDSDGFLDAVASTYNGIAYILHDDGSGSFTIAQTLSFPGKQFLGVELGDLNSDGDLDAVLIDFSNPGLNLILINDGTGYFIDNGKPIPSYFDTYDKLGDLDGDGDLDLFAVSGGFDPGTLRVWMNDGTGDFTLVNDFDSAYEHVGVALGDLNSDGFLDAFTTGWNNTFNKVWLNDGHGGFSEAQVMTNANTFAPLLGDLNGDGNLDVYLANSVSPLIDTPDEVWLNNGTGQFTDSGQRLHTVPSLIPGLGDLNADGNLDVYLPGSYDTPNPDEVWLNDGTGTFSFRYALDDDYYGAWANLGDLDNDGDLDVITGSNSHFVVFINSGWIPAKPINEPLAANLVQCVNDADRYYLVGGMGTNFATSNRRWRYDIADQVWVRLADMPAPRRAIAAACYQGKIYTAGGWHNFQVFDSLYIYDIASDTWQSGPNLPDTVWAAALGAWDGKLFLVGGNQTGDQYCTPVDRVDIYDITGAEWTRGGGQSLPVATACFGSIQVGPYVYIVGGTSGDPEQNVDQTQRYNMAADQWELGPPFTSARALGTLAATGSHLFMLGGDLDGDTIYNPTDLVEELDLSTWPDGSWTDSNDPLPAINLIPASTCSEGVTGGEIWSVGGTDSMTVYDSNLYRPTEPCASYGVALSAPQSGTGEIGHTVEYLLTITNTGTITDYYALVQTDTWQVGSLLGDAIGPVTPGGSLQAAVQVYVPQSAHVGDQGWTDVTVSSLSDPFISGNTTFTTTVVGNDVHIDPESLAGFGIYGETIAYTLTVSNQADITDTVSLTYTGSTWEVSLPVESFELAPAESAQVVLTVIIPADAWVGQSDTLVLTATSAGNPAVSDIATLTTTAFWYRTLISLTMRN